MTEPKDILYRNWIKAALGLLYVKKGIQDFIVDEINNFHTGVLGKLPGAGRCTAHSIQNVLRCPTWGVCSRLPCRFHDNTDPGKTYTPCPICDAIRNYLIKAHRYGGPAYKNTTAQMWCTTSWELAKCFMPATGYCDKNTADDTDLSGLISVILNHKDIQNQIAENLEQPGNKFEKVRQARHDIMHNANMETSTTDLNSYFLILNDVLNDSKHLQNLTKVKNARDKLHQLQRNLITITTEDEQRVREESLKALKRKTKEGIHEIDTRKKESIEEIDVRKEESIQKFDRKKEESVEEICKVRDNSKQEIYKMKEIHIKEIEIKTKESVHEVGNHKREGFQDIDAKMDTAIKEIEKAKDETVQMIGRKNEESVQEIKRSKEDYVQEIVKMKIEFTQEFGKNKEEEIKARKLNRKVTEGFVRTEKMLEKKKKHKQKYIR